MMKILMIAPEPYFEPRGTPFSEYYRIKALCSLGHEVHLVTYPFGEDKSIKGLRIFRSLSCPFIKTVKTGPSLVKIILDFFLVFKVIERLITEKYNLIHTHEEANIIGVLFNKILKIPHLYDMHSSLVQQMQNFQFTKSRLIIGIFKMIEKISLANANSVIVICPALYEYSKKYTSSQKLTTIENFIDETPEKFDNRKLSELKQQFNVSGKKIITYTGTLEPYQGIPLLIASMKYLAKNHTLVLIGGNDSQIKNMNRLAKSQGLKDRVCFLGSKDYTEIPYYLKISDVLVSPRSAGTNTPLKIYSYLRSGIPVVATNLYTHTQILNKNIAVLVKPEPAKFAAGIEVAISTKGKKISKNAAEYCEKNYSYQRYLSLVKTSLEKAFS